MKKSIKYCLPSLAAAPSGAPSLARRCERVGPLSGGGMNYKNIFDLKGVENRLIL